MRFKSASSTSSLIVIAFIAFAFVSSAVVALSVMIEESKSSRERMTDWDAANNSYNDDDCISTWDKLVGGIQSVATFGSFKDIDRAKLIDAEPPKYDSCIKRAANYTLACPNETIYVHGCNGITYENACIAERNGIYNYSTENGVVSN